MSKFRMAWTSGCLAVPTMTCVFGLCFLDALRCHGKLFDAMEIRSVLSGACLGDRHIFGTLGVSLRNVSSARCLDFGVCIAISTG